MKKLILIVIILLSINNFAQTKALDSEITSVTVFRQNAEITRELGVNLTNGTQEIVLAGISTQINPSSLQVLLSNDTSTLLSAKYELNYLKPISNTPETQELKEQLEQIDDELNWIQNQKEILNGMETVLNLNKDLGGREKPFTPGEVIELTNTYKSKLLAIRKEIRDLNKEAKTLTTQKTKLQGQLNEMNASFNKPSGNIVLKIASKSKNTVFLKCKYLVSNAGWTPLYDLRSGGITENVRLSYKANVFQSTGNDWKNVNVIVSTGNPMQNNNRPILNPLYAQLYRPNYYSNELNEVVVTGQGNRRIKKQESAYNLAYDQDDISYKDGYQYDASLSANQLTIEYEINNRQTVKSDGKYNLIGLDQHELTTEYVYHTVPKMNCAAFLLAKISDWGKHNIVNGEANIFFEGAYIGKTTINTNVTGNELLVSMGRDNSIVIERKPVTEFKTAKLIGTNKREIFGYDIWVKNKKSVPITIEVLDQIPISQNKLIQVELKEKGNAEFTKETGKLLWKLELQPGQNTKERFVYSVKYPKKERITGIR